MLASSAFNIVEGGQSAAGVLEAVFELPHPVCVWRRLKFAVQMSGHVPSHHILRGVFLASRRAPVGAPLDTFSTFCSFILSSSCSYYAASIGLTDLA